MSDFTQVVVAKASIYALVDNRNWQERGQGGNLMLYYYNTNRTDMLCRWWKGTNSLAYQLVPGKLKEKGERSWVLRAYNMGFNPPVEEILAIRFAEKNPSETFKLHYQKTSEFVSQQKQQKQRQQQYNYQQQQKQKQQQQYQNNNYYQQQQQQQNRQNNFQQQKQQVNYQQYQPKQQNKGYNSFQQQIKQQQQQQQQQQQKQELNKESNPFGKWECTICTYANNLTNQTCEMCQKSRTKNAKVFNQKPDLNQLNTQSIRGFSNIPKNKNEFQQESSDEEDQQNNKKQEKSDTWNCHACTYTNPNTAPKCGICNTENSNKKEDDYDIVKQMLRQRKSQSYQNDNNQNSYSYNNNQHSYNNINQYNNNKQNQQKEEQLKSSTWECTICTLRNPFNVNKCSACNTAKTKIYNLQDHDDNQSINSRYMDNIQQNNQKQDRRQFGNRFQQGNDDEMRRDNSSKSLFDPYQQNNNQNKKMPNEFVTEFQKVQKLANSNGIKQRTEQDFSRAAGDIACYNDNPSPVFSTLRSVAKKLLKDEIRYRTLDTTNPKVMERLIGYEGVLDFLMLLGFEADSMGQKLVCQDKPPKEVVKNAIEILDHFEQKFGRFRRNKTDVKNNNNQQQQQNQQQQEEEEDDNMTLQQIVLWCTHENMRDNETMETLIMCHKDFSTSLTLIQELKKRFFVNIPQNIQGNKQKEEEFTQKTMKPIQLNVIKNLRNWMKQYWQEDYKDDKKVQDEVDEWIKKMCENAKLYSWNGLLADTVRNELKRYRKYGVSKKEIKVDYTGVIIPKKFNINSLSPGELADQITIMDMSIFSQIKPRECLGQAWKKKDNTGKAPNILAMIQQFNHLTTFVQIQILREKSLKDRGRAMKRIIKMGEHFRELKNYNSLCAVFSALNSAPIHRLKYAWERVPQKQKSMFDQFKVIFASGHNHRNLRQLFRNAAAPSIPHIGIFLQDLVFIDDGNDDEKDDPNLQRKMVNFNKSVRMADRIKNIQMYQQHPYTKIKSNNIVQKILREEFKKLSDITEDTIWDMSTEIKKQDERDKNRYF